MIQDRVFAWPADDKNAYHYGRPNPASEPKSCGLEIIDQLDEDDLSYEYNTIIAWRDTETGRVYVAQDSGCSCPTPFETFEKLSDLTLIAHASDAQDFVRTVNTENYDGSPTFPLRDVFRFISKIDAVLRGETPV